MDTKVTALQIDGLPLGGASIRDAILRRNADEWVVVIQAEWSSDLCDRIRRTGALDRSAIAVSTAEEELTGIVRVEMRGEVAAGVVEVWAVGRGVLGQSARSSAAIGGAVRAGE